MYTNSWFYWHVYLIRSLYKVSNRISWVLSFCYLNMIVKNFIRRNVLMFLCNIIRYNQYNLIRTYWNYHSFIDMSSEILNRVYTSCVLYVVNIVYIQNRCNFWLFIEEFRLNCTISVMIYLHDYTSRFYTLYRHNNAPKYP